MFNRLSNSWQLVKASANVLKTDKELVVFPILSAVALVIVSLIFVLPMIVANIFDDMFKGSSILGYAILFLFYIVQYCVIFFSNTALVGAALIRLRGGDPTVSDGLHIALRRLGPILGYAVIAATFGMVLKLISEKSKNFLAQMLLSFLQFGWNVATFLVVPVLAIENVGPIDAIKRSAAYLKKTWGEQIVGDLAISTIFTFINIGIILLGVILTIGAVSSNAPTAIVIAIILLFVMVLIFSILIGSTLSSIFVAAVYQFTTSGNAGPFFDESLVQKAFRQRNLNLKIYDILAESIYCGNKLCVTLLFH
jgi:hypothetical protein